LARLSLLLPNLASGGAERVALSLAEEFLSQGHEVDLVLVQAEGALISQVPAGAQLFDLRAKRLRNALRPLIHYLRERRPAAVQASMWPLTIVAIVAARLSGTKSRVVVSDHSILSQQYRGSSLTLAALKSTTRLVYPLADARVCVSQGCAADLANLSGLSRDSFSVVHNPMLRPPARLASNPAIERLWAGAERRILTVGTLKEAKNHALLIRAFALMGTDAAARLMIVGDGPLRASLDNLVDELDLGGRVLLPGETSDPWPYYASANLFVLSSDREGLPGVLMEAMLAGLPVVSTNCGTGPSEILEGGAFGRLVPVGNAQALADAMAAALAEQHDPGPGRQQALQLSQGSEERYLDLMLGHAAAGAECR